MPRPITKAQMDDLWFNEFVNEDAGLCCLCGNHGWIDTRGKVKSPAGVPAGALRYCICPNGRKLKKLGVPLPVKETESIFDDPSDVEGMSDYPGMVVEPYMRSAGAEISRYAFEMEKLGLPREDVLRMVEIGAWATMGKLSDHERALVQIAGGVVGIMRRAGYPFKEDAPIVSQWRDFVSQQLGIDLN